MQPSFHDLHIHTFTEASHLEARLRYNCIRKQGMRQWNAFDTFLVGSQLSWSLNVQWNATSRSLEKLRFRAYKLLLWENENVTITTSHHKHNLRIHFSNSIITPKYSCSLKLMRQFWNKSFALSLSLLF